MKVAINGIGIAGPTLAYWLRRCGHEVLLVEEAPALRRGGYIIDFWGLGYDVAEKMGLLERILPLGYRVRELRIVDERGRARGGVPIGVFDRLTAGRFTSLRRSDLSAAIFEALDDGVETIFGDSVAEIGDEGGRLRISFDRSAARTVDLLVGADGLHSRVRRIAFDPQAHDEPSLGYHVAAFEAEGYRPRDEGVYVSHAVPGRQVSRFAMRDDRTLFLFVFLDEYLANGEPVGERGRRAALRAAFADMGWECPRILDALDGAGELYFDPAAQVRSLAWSQGRTALVGDAAACVSLFAGEGAALAMAEAYVLAGELHQCGDDLALAFARYQARMAPLAARKQQAAARFASAFAPKTAAGLRFRNLVTRFLQVPAVADYFLGRAVRDGIVLPDYPFGPGPERRSGPSQA